MSVERCDIKGRAKDNALFCLVLALYLLYLGYALFRRGFFVDELFNFHYYMQKSPAYVISTYNEPNNHVLYSLLGCFLWHTFRSPLLAVRGISFICAAVNIVLLYTLLRRMVSQLSAVVGVCAFAANQQINFESIQGRGYTLTMTAFLLGLLLLEKICENEKIPARQWLLYGALITVGLYTVPTYLYAAAILCALGGIVLLCRKKPLRLAQLAGCSLAGGVAGICCYLPIVYQAGTEAAAGEGVSRWAYFAAQPLKCLWDGRKPLLNNVYVSAGISGGPIEKAAYILREMLRFLRECYHLVPVWLAAALLLAALTGVILLVRKNFFWGSFGLLSVPVCLAVILVQGTFPFDRCLLYLAVPLAVGIAFLAETLSLWRNIAAVCAVLLAALFVWHTAAFRLNSASDGNLDAQILGMREQLSEPCNVFIANTSAMLHLEFWKLQYGWDMELAYLDGTRFDYAVLSAGQNEPGGNLDWADWYSYEELAEIMPWLQSIASADPTFTIYTAMRE